MRDTWVGGCRGGLEMAEMCGLCEGSGLRIVEESGRMVARPCECRVERRIARSLAQAKIPKRYQHCTLESYSVSGRRGDDRTLAGAHLRARKFVDLYHLQTEGTGLLFTGSVGVGKTHLAVGILKKLIEERGVQGVFCDYRELLKEVQDSYNPSVSVTEMQVLRPIFAAEILVLDELGASKPSEWVWDTVAHILNTRYNERRTTIITTNYMNTGPLGTESDPKSKAEPDTPAGEAARAAMRKETLGDRIGERMRSRLQEMCVVVEMYGKDHRDSEKRASFASDKTLAIAPAAPRPVAEEGIPNASTLSELLLLGRKPIDEPDAALQREKDKSPVGANRMGKNKREPRDVNPW
jgi:DNA replication protein DnaC